MSTSTNPEKYMPLLLNLLGKAKEVAKADDGAVLRFEAIEKHLQSMDKMGLLPRVKLFDQTLSKQLTAIERRLGKIVIESTYNMQAVNDALDLIDKDVQQILNDSVPLVEPMPLMEPIPESIVHWSKVDQSGLDKKMSEEWSQLGLEDIIHESSPMHNLRRTYEDLESMELKLCFLSLSIFPDVSLTKKILPMKKRPLIYWWIGEGFIKRTQEKTAEEVGEAVFERLMRKGLINATHSNASSSAFVNSCTMHSWIRRMLISLASEARLFHFHSRWPRMPSFNTSTCRHACLVFGCPIPQEDRVDDLLTVFNVNEQYLALRKEWLNKLKKVVVLQLGRWQDLATHHIEVEVEGFLKGLGAQNKHLKYLSLRGISRIIELPSSILNLISLEILDLRACHNLETLPSDISSLKKLTHLDISECYLLERMPKGIEKLSSLEVLKGFVIGSWKNTPCRLGDLAKLKNLRRLSIHMGNEAVVQPGEFKRLKDISSLRRLKISWGVTRDKEKIVEESSVFSFPLHLEKLDLQGIPLKQVPQWLVPSHLGNLKKLYISGGELSSLDHKETEEWRVEILRLRYLTKFKTKLPRLKELFPHLEHLDLDGRNSNENENK